MPLFDIGSRFSVRPPTPRVIERVRGQFSAEDGVWIVPCPLCLSRLGAADYFPVLVPVYQIKKCGGAGFCPPAAEKTSWTLLWSPKRPPWVLLAAVRCIQLLPNQSWPLTCRSSAHTCTAGAAYLEYLQVPSPHQVFHVGNSGLLYQSWPHRGSTDLSVDASAAPLFSDPVLVFHSVSF